MQNSTSVHTKPMTWEKQKHLDELTIRTCVSDHGVSLLVTKMFWRVSCFLVVKSQSIFFYLSVYFSMFSQAFSVRDLQFLHDSGTYFQVITTGTC